MDYKQIEKYIFSDEKIDIQLENSHLVEDSFSFLEQFSKEKVIYGINTGFGPMAQYRIDDDDLRALQYNIIRSHATGTGEAFSPIEVRAAMLARYCTFSQGKSGVHIDTMRVLEAFINHHITPFIPQHGSVGASGDLVQLAHLALTLIGEGEVFYKGQRRNTAEVLQECGIQPLVPKLREGLALTNGTAMMTGVGIVNLHYAKKLLNHAVNASILINEIAASYDDFMAEKLNDLKGHQGQSFIANQLREIAASSKAFCKRDVEMYHLHQETVFNHKVQPYYSLRCVPQILGPIHETLCNVERILVEEFNAVDDNPIVDVETQMVYHGGNFHGDYVSFEMDKLKIAMVKLSVLIERQLNYLCHDRINGILPPFLNMGKLGLNYGIQAMQFTATSTTAECQTLSTPMYVHSIPNNNDNQDVVSMGTNAAILAKRVIENVYQVMAIHFIALVQAVDCLDLRTKLSDNTGKIYDKVRAIVPKFVEDTPKYQEIEKVIKYLKKEE